MLNRPSSTLILCLGTAALSACSWFQDRPPEYVGSPEGDPLKVPADLDQPVYASPIVINAPPMRTPTGDELNPSPPRVASTAGGGDANAYLAWSAKGVYLLIKDSPESVARRLGFAIERSGMNLLERNPDGSHRFEFAHLVYDDRNFWQRMKFWDNDLGPNYSGVYRTEVEEDPEGARVYLYFDNGTPATTTSAEHVLGIFMERLG